MLNIIMFKQINNNNNTNTNTSNNNMIMNNIKINTVRNGDNTYY